MKSNKMLRVRADEILRQLQRQQDLKWKKKDQHEGEHYIYCLPSLNPSSAGALPSSFGRADVNSLTGLGSKCLIRSGKNDLFNTSGPIK